MKTFFSSMFIENEKLREAEINYPIQLEYYKIINEDELMKQEGVKFGIYIVKTEYKKEKVKIEDKKIQYVSNDERKIEEILNILKRNEVPPVTAEEILRELSQKAIML